MVCDNVRISGISSKLLRNESFVPSAAELSEHLIKNLSWGKNEIKILITVTQTPKFFLPSTAFYIQKEIGIGFDCLVYDINLGATGFITGTQTIAALLGGLTEKGKALLILGDNADGDKESPAAVVAIESIKESTIVFESRAFDAREKNMSEIFEKAVPQLLVTNRLQEMQWGDENDMQIFCCEEVVNSDSPAVLPWVICKNIIEISKNNRITAAASGAGPAAAVMDFDIYDTGIYEIIE